MERDPWNRLRSVVEDSHWVVRVAQSLLHLPVVANLRCGAWYLSPHLPETSRESTYCYFKSTDGHAHEWNFSLKRPNLEVVHLIQRRGGAVIVDSTRRGKSLPDALSKTIPIWCAVLTEASRRKYGTPSSPLACQTISDETASPFRDVNCSKEWPLMTPAHQVPPSEHGQIEERIDEWVTALLSSDLPIPRLSLPLVPMFLTPPTTPDGPAEDAGPLVDGLIARLQAYGLPHKSHPVILLSASRRVDLPSPDPTGSYYYVQGSGDDEELWSFGLTPDMFWSQEHYRRLLSATREELRLVIQETVRSSKMDAVSAQSSWPGEVACKDIAIGTTGLCCGIRRTDHVFSDEEKASFDLIVHCDAGHTAWPANVGEKEPVSGAHMFFERIPQGKKGLPTLKDRLPRLLAIVQEVIISKDSLAHGPKILIVDSTRKDLSLCIVVAILAHFFEPHTQSHLASEEEILRHHRQLTKADVRKRLQWVVRYIPEANPSRSHLLRVNEVLLRRS